MKAMRAQEPSLLDPQQFFSPFEPSSGECAIMDLLGDMRVEQEHSELLPAAPVGTSTHLAQQLLLHADAQDCKRDPVLHSALVLGKLAVGAWLLQNVLEVQFTSRALSHHSSSLYATLRAQQGPFAAFLRQDGNTERSCVDRRIQASLALAAQAGLLEIARFLAPHKHCNNSNTNITQYAHCQAHSHNDRFVGDSTQRHDLQQVHHCHHRQINSLQNNKTQQQVEQYGVAKDLTHLINDPLRHQYPNGPSIPPVENIRHVGQHTEEEAVLSTTIIPKAPSNKQDSNFSLFAHPTSETCGILPAFLTQIKTGERPSPYPPRTASNHQDVNICMPATAAHISAVLPLQNDSEHPSSQRLSAPPSSAISALQASKVPLPTARPNTPIQPCRTQTCPIPSLLPPVRTYSPFPSSSTSDTSRQQYVPPRRRNSLPLNPSPPPPITRAQAAAPLHRHQGLSPPPLFRPLSPVLSATDILSPPLLPSFVPKHTNNVQPLPFIARPPSAPFPPLPTHPRHAQAPPQLSSHHHQQQQHQVETREPRNHQPHPSQQAPRSPVAHSQYHPCRPSPPSSPQPQHMSVPQSQRESTQDNANQSSTLSNGHHMSAHRNFNHLQFEPTQCNFSQKSPLSNVSHLHLGSSHSSANLLRGDSTHSNGDHSSTHSSVNHLSRHSDLKHLQTAQRGTGGGSRLLLGAQGLMVVGEERPEVEGGEEEDVLRMTRKAVKNKKRHLRLKKAKAYKALAKVLDGAGA